MKHEEPDNTDDVSESLLMLKLDRDMKESLKTVTPDQARFLIDGYEAAQKRRMQLQGQIRSMSEEPTAFLEWMVGQAKIAENQYKIALRYFAQGHHMGRWAMGIRGCGPVTSAALLAHIRIEKAPTAGHIWSFAGFNPQAKWEKRTKRPWNTRLKTQCFLLGECFVRSKNHDDAYYGRLYEQRKAYETQKNAAGDYKDQAEAKLAVVGKDTECAKHNREGRLSPGHIHLRAMRWTIKLFLAHWHRVAYVDAFGKEPPLPYPIEHMGHVHYLEGPKVA